MKTLISLGAARKNAGYTQKEVSTLVGIHVSTLQRLEKDSTYISEKLFTQLAVLYGIKKEDIFLGKEHDLIVLIRGPFHSKNVINQA